MHFLGLQARCRRSCFFYLNTKTIFVFRHVSLIFTYHEHILPYLNPNQPFQWTYHSNHHTIPDIEPEPPKIDEPDQHKANLDKERRLGSSLFSLAIHNLITKVFKYFRVYKKDLSSFNITFFHLYF